MATDSSDIAISIIIPTCGRLDGLRRILDLIWPQIEMCRVSCEVLVCDDSGGKDVEDLLADCSPQTEWLPVPRRGAGACRNSGAEHANGQWLLFLDDDVLPQPGLLSAYSDAFFSAGSSEVAFEGATLLDRPVSSLLWEAPANPNCTGHPSCNWGIRKSFFMEAMGFDERYLRSQDIEFAARVGAMGREFRPLPQAVVIHPLRPVPTASALAARWEYKLLYALDLGIDPLAARYRIPWHAFRVIQSRFRGASWSYDNFVAMGIFAYEWALVLWRNGAWIEKWRTKQPSEFWTQTIADGYRVAKYGL